MRILQLSSGNPIADGRAAYAKSYAEALDFAAAADLMRQTLDLVPDWPAGWSLLGDYLRGAGDVAGAVAAWHRLRDLDHEGLFGAGLKLAAHGAGAARPDPGYVEALFDDYAERFDAALVGRLHYRTPRDLAGLLSPHLRGGRAGVALDLGCGTGLMGAELRPLVDRLAGVDLSAAMLAKAAAKQIYDELVHDDLLAFLATRRDADLVTASDVLNYTGPLAPVLSAIHAAMAAGGLLAFSLEIHDGPEPMVLRDTLRFAHRPDAAVSACDMAGFEVLAAADTILRVDRGAPVRGTLVLARRR